MKVISIFISIFCAVICVQAASLPHVIYFLIDDWGWSNAGYHRPGFAEVVTPNIDGMVSEGIELDRVYGHKFCGPSRAAIQSGRLPIHVTVLDNPLDSVNPKDPDGGFQGIPRNMTGIASKLKQAGYATKAYGKWHNGVATSSHTPQGRGYDTSLHYFDAANDYYTQSYLHPCKGENTNLIDFWNTDGPANKQNNPSDCSQTHQPNTTCPNEDDILGQQAVADITAHDPSIPLFMYFASHSIHEPYEAPNSYLNKFKSVDVEVRQYYDAMVNHVDDVIGTIVTALKAKGMWDNTLIICTSDNGGPLAKGDIVGLVSTSGANNYPLRGGKIGIMEGGIRLNAFLSGGYLPANLRGTKNEEFMHLADWYATLCAIAGVDPTDTKAAAANLPPIDSLNMWPMLSGQVKNSPRMDIPLGSSDNADNAGNTIVQGFIDVNKTSNTYGLKLILGSVDPAFFQGPVYPNISSTVKPPHLVCGDPDGIVGAKGPGCLFDIVNDPYELTDISSQYPGHVAGLRNKIKDLQKNVYNPDRGGKDPAFCTTGYKKWGGFVGPWID